MCTQVLFGWFFNEFFPTCFEEWNLTAMVYFSVELMVKAQYSMGDTLCLFNGMGRAVI